MDSAHDRSEPEECRRRPHHRPATTKRRRRQCQERLRPGMCRMITDPATTSFSSPRARFKQNALHFATSKGNLSTVRTLLANKCSARVKDRRGQLPLHRAAAIGSIPIIKLLLEEGKSPVNATDIDGLTALHHAISEGHGDAAITLLKAGAEADKKDSEGRLAIEMAPDAKVKKYILQTAEREGIEL
ncbi:ankyrin repeat domain-containing protein [Aspergillus novofumigatus IBT 16806]|uniref:Ankyrin n=1 Tax=Aspergillus novofumigatus (strain IBT 16806) TaxID=1392255 RepID=A0A2I1C9I1_ASPN1|nr:ankyrin [Aspergillus novofumigatus IBT 16806]PKX94299.1 ankyrin [Aspergillus novofumigatus IBT 16806]